ncbi:Imm1 family immunity protein [Kitasatospora sp. NPDC054795]
MGAAGSRRALDRIPGPAEIPVDLVRRAVKEFRLPGGRRPTRVTRKDRYPEE